MKHIRSLFFISTTLAFLGGCDTFRDSLGLNHYQPDEFKVSENAPLSMPRDYALRPPTGSDSSAPLATTTYNSSKEAQKTLLGRTTEVEQSAHPLSSEKSLVAAAQKEQKTDPNIRQTVNEEAKVHGNPGDQIADKLAKMGKQIKKNASDTGDDTTKTASLDAESS